MKTLFRLFYLCVLVALARSIQAQPYTLGIGRYPGAPVEDFSPRLVPSEHYRNVALHRQATASSTFDYNLTPQLLTDGFLHEGAAPARLRVRDVGRGVWLPLREREWTLDGGPYSSCTLMGSSTGLEYVWEGMDLEADRLVLHATVAYRESTARPHYMLRAETSDDGGRTWQTAAVQASEGWLGEASAQKVPEDPNKQTGATALPTRRVVAELPLDARRQRFHHLRIVLTMEGAVYWTVSELQFFHRGTRLTRSLLPSSRFVSTWESATGNRQWVAVDLAQTARFDSIRLHWTMPPQEGYIERSDDGQTWHRLCALPRHSPKSSNIVDQITCHGSARHLRIVMTHPGQSGRYGLSEVEVTGRGGVEVLPHAEAGHQGNRFVLNGGDWRVQRADQVPLSGEALSRPCRVDGWPVATVPATVLTSFVRIGALPDPNLSDGLFAASESFFNSDFWYRRTFVLPTAFSGRRIQIHLDGINWKAEIYLNGHHIHRIEGAFRRGEADITPYLHEGENVLAVRILANAHPGAVKEKCALNTDINGGILGADNPTFHATIGWDWISTIRGRDIGIWNDVYLTATGDVTLSDPVITTALRQRPDTVATLTPAVFVRNHSRHAVEGVLRGQVGGVRFEQSLHLAPNSVQEVRFTPEAFPQLRDCRLPLWWPNGYGNATRHPASFAFVADGTCTDSISFQAGLRTVELRDAATALQIQVNGRRFVPLGGNWGFSEAHLNYRGREYDAAVAYHRAMNANTIRNWVGQTGDEEFYDACDRHGILVWQDFWLANPWDGPDPEDEPMFIDNARDYVRRIRRHPSVGLYCGRNEGYPPPTLDRALRQTVDSLHPGLGYISSSADEGVSGHGPYRALPAAEYFRLQTGRLHSERGMPCMMNPESLLRTLPPAGHWPQGAAWGRHDFTQQGAQRGTTFNELVVQAFGTEAMMCAERFAQLAQWVNYHGYRAMFEGQNLHRQGLLIWMSHPAWPSLTWQTYDYFLEPTAAFFAVQKACEPLHIQYNALTDSVEVVNRLHARRNLTVQFARYDSRGRMVGEHILPIAHLAADTTCALLPASSSGVAYTAPHLLRLCLWDGTPGQSRLLSVNDYWRTTPDGDFSTLLNLPHPPVQMRCTHINNERIVFIELPDTCSAPAVFLRLNLVGSDGQQILPVHYSDNYFTILPGEKRQLTLRWRPEDDRGTRPLLRITGLNVEAQEIDLGF